MTAITSTSMVAPRSIEAGSMWPFQQTNTMPPIAAMKPAKPKASVRCSATL